MKNWKLFLITTFLLGTFLRFYQLEKIPAGLHQDEASLGYNAYSILKTGRDMTGNLFPMHLESFYYSPAGYSYLSIPFIALFDLNVFSIRFTSALFGSLTIISTFFLSKKLLKKYKYVDVVSIFSAFSYAVSPWSINLSRTATENVPVVFFISLGVLLYLYWYESEKKIFVILSFVLFFLSLFIYQAPRSFLPFLVPLLFIFFSKKSWKTNIYLFTAYLVLIILPVLLVISSYDISYRIRTLSIFNFPQTQLLLNEAIREDGVASAPLILTRVFHNKFLGYVSQFMQNYFDHFSYNFLFQDYGFPLRYKIFNMGLLYIYELPLLILGVFKIIKTKSKEGLFLILWILLAPIGSSLTFDDVPNLQRTLFVYPALAIIAGLGLADIIANVKNVKTSLIISGVVTCIVVFNIGFYLHQYYIHQLVHKPFYRQDGYDQAVIYTNKVYSDYDKIIVTESQGVPTILFSFFSKYNPLKFQEEVSHKNIEQIANANFGKYMFIPGSCPSSDFNDPKLKRVLFIDTGNCSIRSTQKIRKEIFRSDGVLIFRIVENIR